MATEDGRKSCTENMPPEQAFKLGRIMGMKEGVRRFAWWKDGEQFVGTTGKTLRQALAEIEEEYNR